MNRPKWLSCLLLIGLVALLAGCAASRDMVVLIPDEDGTVGQATVTNKAGTVELDTANQATTVESREKAPSQPVVKGQAELDAIFSEALAIQPPSPVHFSLYFETDSTTLVPESLELLPTVLEAIGARAVPDISVVGHSDTSGNEDYNLELSTRRAVAVGELLTREGIEEASLEITSHGESNPLIPTDDEVDEPRNRRVDVVVR